MPIYEQTYRTYEGQLRRHFRWWTIVKQELRVLISQRAFLVLMVAALMHFIFRILQIVAYDIIRMDPNNPINAMIQNVAMLVVNEGMFYDFLRIQSSMVFLACIFAGAGMICDDTRNNLMEVYFSKPMSWRDYVLGKTMTLVAIGLTVTAVPALILVLLHNILAPGWKTLGQTYWYPGAILAFSLIIVLPCATGVLASSALLKSQRFAAIAVFMILFGDLAMGGILSEALHKQNYLIVAFPAALDHLGSVLFKQRHPVLSMHWKWPALYVAIVCGSCLWIVCRRVKRAEVAA
ncbi:MAG: ABC transporter permease subunit [Candidatus Hydrogenedentes bacterium]|nr:ABC transporter permease subunit [Candidatus Hydrogenedentota bacterium]